jgi:hypothetical protein
MGKASVQPLNGEPLLQWFYEGDPHLLDPNWRGLVPSDEGGGRRHNLSHEYDGEVEGLDSSFSSKVLYVISGPACKLSVSWAP